jgi:hypothetical protein
VPPLIHRANATFWQYYRKLPTDIQARADKQFALLKANPWHASLKFKKIKVHKGQEIWSARVTLKYRAVAIRFPDAYVWIWIGEHGQYDLLIK